MKWKDPIQERYYRNHHASVLQRHANYRKANSETIRAKEREKYWSDPEKARAKNREYHKKNYRGVLGEKIRIRVKKWQTENKDKFYSLLAKRRAQKKSATIGNVSVIAEWERKWKQKHTTTCYWCGRSISPRNCHTDHISPLSLGGAHSIENVCVSCSSCNLRKNSKPMQKWNFEIRQPVLL